MRRTRFISALMALAIGLGLISSTLAGPTVASAATVPPSAIIGASAPAITAGTGSADNFAGATVVAAKDTRTKDAKRKSGAKATECKGQIVRTRNLLKPGTKTVVAEQVVYYSTAKKGTLCAKVNLLGKARGLSKSKRRYTGVYICRGNGTGCYVSVVKGIKLNAGKFKWQAGPVKLTHVNKRHILIFGFSFTHKQWKSKKRPQYPSQYANQTLLFKGKKPLN